MAGRINVKVDSREMRDAANEVKRLAQNLAEDFDDMQTRVQRTTAYWIGEAGDHYRQEFLARREETEQILNYLYKYPTDLLTMAQIYEDTESTNTQTLGALSSDFITG